MTQQSKNLEVYVDDSSGVIFSPRITKVLFTSTHPGAGDDDPFEQEVLTLVMPTDTLLTFCLTLLKGFAKNGEGLLGHLSENNGLFSTAIKAAEAISASESFLAVEDAYSGPSPKQKPRGPKKKPVAGRRASRVLTE